jgi:hypothetical protein
MEKGKGKRDSRLAGPGGGEISAQRGRVALR